MGENLRGGAQLQNDTLRKSLRTLKVKLVLLGSSGVGKSSLALRFSKDEFRRTSPTVGCAYLTRVVHLSNVTLRLEIWDTAGQEKYHSVTPLYYRGAHAALLVYDISKRETFIRAQVWLKELEKQYIPWIDCHMAGRQQGRSSNTSTSLSGGRTESGQRQGPILYRGISTVRGSNQRAASSYSPQSVRVYWSAAGGSVRVERDTSCGSA
ncbi:Ras-related protein Rab-17 [Larimichthys crocea]|uniref:Uncharacterized protein n=1 Tax=Larimichthys crocea TaxID=215358 RepID=A0ACD3QG98_LARCR|nr:Ras-related protein Rab-17 [Larimichthys crocea]